MRPDVNDLLMLFADHSDSKVYGFNYWLFSNMNE